MWLTDRLVPDHKTIADFRKGDCVAIDGSKFRAVSTEATNATGPKDRTFTKGEIASHMAHLEADVE